jgi:hypothetical protein
MLDMEKAHTSWPTKSRLTSQNEVEYEINTLIRIITKENL